MVGTTVCYSHGGNKPSIRTAGRRRHEAAKAERRVVALIRHIGGEVDPDFDASAQLQRMVWLSSWQERIYAAKVSEELGEDWLTEVSYGVQGKRPEIHPWVKAWEASEERSAKFAKMAIDAGIAERQVQLTEEMAGTMATAIRAVVFDIDIRLEPWQQERILDGLSARLNAA